jgi:hypothetical protein
VRRGALAFDVLQLGVDLGQRLAQRRDEIVDRFLPAGQIGRGGRLQFAELFLRQVEKARVVLRQDVGGNRGEGVLQRVACLLEDGELLGGVLLLRLEPRAQRRFGLLCLRQRITAGGERRAGLAERPLRLASAAL